MNVRDFECRSWFKADALLGKRNSRVVCNNTVLKRDGFSSVIYLLLHGHPIATFHKDRGVTVRSCGWRTGTTQDRLNRVLPGSYRIFQRKFEWFVSWSGCEKAVPFEENQTYWTDKGGQG